MYAIHVNGEAVAQEDYDEMPTVSVSFPGEEGITEYRCNRCGETTQEEPDASNVDPESLCEVTTCDQCGGSGEVQDMPSVEPAECVKCAGTGNGAHDWQAGAHLWLNSARISVEEDSVTVAISVGDPRGAFVMTVERLDDGELRLSVPHPGDPLPHMTLTPRSHGYYRISG